MAPVPGSKASAGTILLPHSLFQRHCDGRGSGGHATSANRILAGGQRAGKLDRRYNGDRTDGRPKTIEPRITRTTRIRTKTDQDGFPVFLSHSYPCCPCNPWFDCLQPQTPRRTTTCCVSRATATSPSRPP